MNTFSNCKAILFDFGGTLDADGVPWKDHFYPIYKDCGLPWTQEEFDPYFYAADDWITEKRLDQVSYLEMLDLQVGLVLKNGNLFDAQLKDKIVQAFYASSMKTLKRNEPLIQHLAEKYALGIISNFYGNLPFLIEEIGWSRYLKRWWILLKSGVLSQILRFFMWH